MTPGQKDNSRWLKAAALGSIWASSEIVLGSFLHNLGVPFCGYFLTAIGICLLVAGHRVWPERGLLWRAGLICAVMKSISPSAIIIGPMVSIFMAGALLEAATLLLGRNPAGYLFGGGLAMSWTLVQKTLRLFISYGADIYRLYIGLMDWLQGQFSSFQTGYWTPAAAVLFLHFAGGMAAAAAGLFVGGKAERLSGDASAPGPRRAGAEARPAFAGPGGEFSLALLFLNLALLPAAMFFLGRAPLWAAFIFTAAYTAFCALTRGPALRGLKKPGFWLGFVLLTLLAGLFLDNFGNSGGISWRGALTGLRMNLRAIVLTAAFSVIGAELRNPLIGGWLKRRGGRGFLSTLEVCFDALPAVITSLPPGSEMLRRPLSSLARMVGRAGFWLNEFQKRSDRGAKFFIITGKRGAGKSTLLAATTDALRNSGVRVGGIHAPGILKDGERHGFDITDLLTGERTELARRNGEKRLTGTGFFRFRPEGMAFGRRALSPARLQNADLAVIDEISYWELEGKGWAPELEALLEKGRLPLLLVVREELLEKVCERWNLQNPVIREAGGGGAAAAAELAPLILGALPERADGPGSGDSGGRPGT